VYQVYISLYIVRRYKICSGGRGRRKRAPLFMALFEKSDGVAGNLPRLQIDVTTVASSRRPQERSGRGGSVGNRKKRRIASAGSRQRKDDARWMFESHGTRGTENAVMTGKHTFEQTYVRSYTLHGWIGLKIGASARWILLVRRSFRFVPASRTRRAHETAWRARARARLRSPESRQDRIANRSERRSTF